MTSLLPVGFTAPLLLGALVVLPLVWWLFRLTPPRPREQPFPGTRLLRDLMRREEQPVRTPWWLTALRMLLLALVILALAGSIWRPDPVRDTARGPLWLVIDNGWAAAQDWKARKATAERLVAQAAGRDRPVALILTAEGPNQPLAPEEAPAIARRLAGIEPRPWWPDRTALLAGLEASAGRAAPGSVAWLGDGLAAGDADFAAEFRRIAGGAPITLFIDPARPVLALTDAENGPDALTATVRRLGAATPAPGQPAPRLAALDEKGREVAAAPIAFKDGELDTKVSFALPSELRNEIARLDVAGLDSAGAVQLIDERWRRRKIGLVAGSNVGAEQPLLSPVHYLTQALAPFADLRQPRTGDANEAIRDLIRDRVSVIVMADIGTVLPETAKAVEDWVSGGGVLIRFAGPRLALGSTGDRLVPVELRQGGRSLGGALSWGQPQHLSDFAATGPFAGMTVPADVTVTRQVLAEPRPDLGAATWASLVDGTPFVTGKRMQNGWVVLFHVTADASWSTLPLSGSFIEMLRRIVAFSVATRSAAQGGDGDGVLLPPYRLLDGYGRSSAAFTEARPLKQSEANRTRPDAQHPPGLYGNEDGVVALNLLKADTRLVPFDAAPLAAAATRSFQLEGERDLRPWLLGAALMAVLADAAAVLAMAGAFAWRRIGTAAVLAAALTLAPQAIRPAAADAASEMQAALGTRLAYVLTGNSAIDDVSKAGLEGLSRAVAERTALEPAQPQGVDVERDELVFYPLIYWPVDPSSPAPSARAIGRIDAYMKNGGTILFDTRDTLTELNLRGATRVSRANEALRRILDSLDIPGLEPVPEQHVLTKAFYILKDFPGRYAGGPLWVEALPAQDPARAAERPVRAGDGVTPIMITGNDFAGAWAQGRNGEYLFTTVPPDPRQRELAYRVGVNIVMYTLTGNYKADQVHVPDLLQRLGQ